MTQSVVPQVFDHKEVWHHECSTTKCGNKSVRLQRIVTKCRNQRAVTKCSPKSVGLKSGVTKGVRLELVVQRKKFITSGVRLYSIGAFETSLS